MFLGFLFPKTSFNQGVGVVLSGGGATGLAHIGVLQALEEAEIPINYISGTSIGAMIGAMYSVGYSPNEIKEYFLSENFREMTKLNRLSMDKKSKEERFLLREKEEDAYMVNFNISFDSIFTKVLPTHISSPSKIDFEMFKNIGHPGASLNKDFDSLFVPFRCVASDIYKKENVVYKNGDLNAAVRASMTYPFYLNPIRIDGVLLFDGGLYNNFPADVLYDEFQMDYIIGSNVSGNEDPPIEDDIISQISTMFVQLTDYSLPCELGIIIEPKPDVGTFEFNKVKEAIEIGYIAAKQQLDSIRYHVHERISVEELTEKRKEFLNQLTPIEINSISVHSFKAQDVSYVENNFKGDTIKRPISEKVFRKRYFRTYAAPQIKYLYPTLTKNSDSTYHLDLDVTKQKPFSIRIGGHFSSRSVNTGYIGLSYIDFGKGAIELDGETYFGKFYTSTKVKADYDLPTLFPIRVSPYFVLNRWDYYKSNSTFFEDVEPSFLLQNELYYGIKTAVPVTNNSKITFDTKKFINKDQYYQTLEYSESDTADVTNFAGESASLEFKLNTLNRKQWASEGTLLKATVRYVQGKEKSISGNTPTSEYDLRRFHKWINFSIEGQRYFEMTPFFKVGIYGKAAINSQSLMSNYTASVLNLTEFAPLPDAQTLFMPEYRAPQFLGGGINLIFNYKKFLELRVDSYLFQPLRQIVQKDDGTFGYSPFLQGGSVPMGGASLIFHSPIGPLRLSTNYFPKQKNPWMLQLSFGYVIFNERAVR